MKNSAAWLMITWAGELPGHTVQTTAFVNEAYLQLIDQRNVQWQNRADFFGIAAHLMRRVLAGYARALAATPSEEAGRGRFRLKKL